MFGYTLDRNQDLPGFDFTFLRRPDGHEIGGIFGRRDASTSTWATTFEVADTDAVAAAATAAGGASSAPENIPYGRMATSTDPFGTEFSVIARPWACIVESLDVVSVLTPTKSDRIDVHITLAASMAIEAVTAAGC